MSRRSFDSGMRPINHYRYESTGMNDRDGWNDSQVFTPTKKRSTSPWLKYGLPVLVVLLVAAGVVAAIVATRHKDNAATSSNGGKSGSGGSSGSGSGGTGANNIGLLYQSADSYGLPVYPSTTNSALFGSPTFNPSAAAVWPSETHQFVSNPQPTDVRQDRPRLIAPAYKWAALPGLIAQDPYLKTWNDTLFGNASAILGTDPLKYIEDGGLTGSGVLDPARELKQRIKVLAYAYRISNETKYADRVFRELVNAAGNDSSNPFGNSNPQPNNNGPDNWNTAHFLDLAEFTNAFAFGYDWLYDYWSADQRNAIMWSILNLGLKWGILGYEQPNTYYYAWWTQPGNNNGNWNCVCNGGLSMGALAILGDDPTGMAAQMLSHTIPNAQTGCVMGPSSDGTWSETPNYWYFGNTAHAEFTSALLTATGSDFGLLNTNPEFKDSGLYHMYVTGMTSLFNYGDHGPNKYSTTANALLFYGTQYKRPEYTLFQRDQVMGMQAEPTAMFWYDPSVSGGFWADLPLDHNFDNGLDQWASMRSSWTTNKGSYIAIKAGNHTGHQTHGDLDAGDFVIDALGERWAGELGSAQYLSEGYFSNETQGSDRWLYYRKRTEGQNCIVLGAQNQNVIGQPTTKFETTGEKQPGGTTVYSVPSTSTAYFTADLTQSYFGQTIKRGMRFINGRKQILVQDDLSNTNATAQWRMHTNASVALSGTSATLTMPSGKTMAVSILNAPSGVTFSTGLPVRLASDPPVPAGEINQDQPNPGVTVLIIEIPQGSNSIQVLFNPQWDGMKQSDFKTPPNVPIDSWSLTSHDS